MNKDLYGNKVELPEEIVGYLKQCHDAVPGANDSIEGYKRNKELRDSGHVTYQQLKRMKNFFDNFQGIPNEPPYILNGGEKMKGWVDGALRFLRDSIYNTKHNKSETGMENQHIQNHEKDFTNVRPSQTHKSTLQKAMKIIQSLNPLI